MNRFEITIDGTALARDFATQADAEAEVGTVRKANDGKTVLVRPKSVRSPSLRPSGGGEVPHVAPPAPPAEVDTAQPQGTPGNPAGASQRPLR